MASRKPKTVYYRRRREGKTNYQKKLRLLMSRKPRLVVRITNRKVIAQLVRFEPKGDRVLLGVDSSQLSQFGWSFSFKNLPAAYLTGLLIGKMAAKKNLNEAVLDSGTRALIPGNKISAFLSGAVEGGMDLPFGGEKVLPAGETVSGKRLEEYAEKLAKNDPKKYQSTFSRYLKSGLVPEKISLAFGLAKEKILGSGSDIRSQKMPTANTAQESKKGEKPFNRTQK